MSYTVTVTETPFVVTVDDSTTVEVSASDVLTVELGYGDASVGAYLLALLTNNTALGRLSDAIAAIDALSQAEAENTTSDVVGLATGRRLAQGAAVAVTAHVAAVDPHTQYTTDAEAGVIASAAVTTHVALSDPHTQYQKESEKDAASGYAGLDGSTMVLANKLGTGTPGATNYLRGDRTWASVSGFTSWNMVPANQWGLAYAGSSATNIAVVGTLAGVTPTATDNSSASGSSSTYLGGTSFRQTGTAVDGNTTSLYWSAAGAAAVPTLTRGTNTQGKAIIQYTFALETASQFFAFNFGGANNAVGTVAQEDPHSVGISFLSGDTQVHAFTRAGASLARTPFLAGTVTAAVTYTLVIDCTNLGGSGAGSVRILLWNWSTQAWVGDATLSSGLPTSFAVGRIALYSEAETASSRTIAHFSLGIAYVGYPLSLP